MEEYGTVKSVKVKEVHTGWKKPAMACFSKVIKRKTEVNLTRNKKK